MFRGVGRGRGRGRASGSAGFSSRAGRGGSGSASSVTRLQKGLFADGIWHCNCSLRLPAEHFKVKKEGRNQGRWFYTCQQQQEKRCDFFLWDEDAKPRAEAAVLSGKRTEPPPDGPGRMSLGGNREVQEGWDAGRGRGGQGQDQGLGMFANAGGRSRMRDPDETDSGTEGASPPPPYTSQKPASSANANGSVKRSAQAAGMDDEEAAFPWPLTGQEEQELAEAADLATPAPQTPQKARKTGVYATPATSSTAKRKLPWEMPPPQQPSTPASSGMATKTVKDYLQQTPSKRLGAVSPIVEERPLETPKATTTPAVAQTPTPARHHDALANPADSASSLTTEALAALSSVRIPPDVMSNLRGILSKHDLKTQGVTRGRDISRLALKSKEAKIAELHKKIESLQADMELDRGVIRQLRWQREHGNGIEGD